MIETPAVASTPLPSNAQPCSSSLTMSMHWDEPLASLNQVPSELSKPSIPPLKPEMGRILLRRSSTMSYAGLQTPQTQLRPPSRRGSTILMPPVSSQLPAATPQPPPMIIRRASLILNATMRAMNQNHSSLVVVNTSCRRQSNQHDDSESSSDDSESDDDLEAHPHDTNQTLEPALRAPTSSSPPYFRLETFMLEDHDTPTSPSSSANTTISAGTEITSPRRMTTPPLSKAAQIDAIFKEIWLTEESYVAALRGLVTQFFEPLQAYAKTHSIALGAMAALHHSTSTILSIHEELLRQLESLQTTKPVVSTPDAIDPFGVGFTGTLARLHQLAHAFLSTIEYMKVYAFYCGSYLSAKQELERLQREHPKLAQFTAQLNECARRGSQEEDIELPPLDINSTLIKPVQRICRYPLLFKQLLTNATGPEETLILQQSLQKIEAVSTYVNEKVRESQNNARLYELHQMLHPSSGLALLQPSRTLLHETWANVVSLDALRWPVKLLKNLRRRRHRLNRRKSSMLSSFTSVNREDWSFLSVFGLSDDRRTSVTANSSGDGSTRTASSNRHSSLSLTSATPALTSPTSNSTVQSPSRLHQRRGSTSGERTRLILLSDMLLMAKLRDHKLKIRRQICLSCAVIHDDALRPAPPSFSTRDRDHNDIEMFPALPTPVDDEAAGSSFMLEVSKVGYCTCHHLTPVTLKRSPKLRSLSVFLKGRRTSGSLASSSATDLYHVLQQHQHETERRQDDVLHYRPSSRSSKTGSRFRYLEQLAGLRSVKRYRVTCDTVQEKRRFLQALRHAIARSARLYSLAHNNSSSDVSLSRPTPSTGAKAVAMAVSLPGKLWRSIRPPSVAGHTAPPNVDRSTTIGTQTRRCGGSMVVDAVGLEADLLCFEDEESDTATTTPWSFQVNAA